MKANKLDIDTERKLAVCQYALLREVKERTRKVESLLRMLSGNINKFKFEDVYENIGRNQRNGKSMIRRTKVETEYYIAIRTEVNDIWNDAVTHHTVMLGSICQSLNDYMPEGKYYSPSRFNKAMDSFYFAKQKEHDKGEVAIELESSEVVDSILKGLGIEKKTNGLSALKKNIVNTMALEGKL